MKKLLFVAVAFAGLTLVSCNKDQSAVNKMEGTWNVTKSETTSGSVTIDNLDAGNITVSMSFNKCKLKTDEWCTGSQTVTWNSLATTDNFVYRVTDDGVTFEQKEHADSTDVTTMTIDELTKKEMKTTWTDGNSTTVTEATKE